MGTSQKIKKHFDQPQNCSPNLMNRIKILTKPNSFWALGWFLKVDSVVIISLHEDRESGVFSLDWRPGMIVLRSPSPAQRSHRKLWLWEAKKGSWSGCFMLQILFLQSGCVLHSKWMWVKTIKVILVTYKRATVSVDAPWRRRVRRWLTNPLLATHSGSGDRKSVV